MTLGHRAGRNWDRISFRQFNAKARAEARIGFRPAYCGTLREFVTVQNQIDRIPWHLRLGILALCVAGLAWTAFGSAGPGGGTAQPLTLSQYVNELDRWQAALEDLKVHPEDSAALRSQVPDSLPVMQDGRRIEVSMRWMQADLHSIGKDSKANAKELKRALTHLNSMKRQAEALMDSPRSTNDAASTKLKAILARREFGGVRKERPSWFDRMMERLQGWLSRLLDSLGSRLAGHPGIAKVLFWILLIGGAGGLLTWLVWQLLHHPRRRTFRPEPAAGPVQDSWRQMAAQAKAAAAAGDYREAIRLAYWAAIHRLGDQGLWTEDHTRTHREYLRLVPPSQPQREPLGLLTKEFEMAWYAERPSSAENFQTVVNQLERLGCR